MVRETILPWKIEAPETRCGVATGFPLFPVTTPPRDRGRLPQSAASHSNVGMAAIFLALSDITFPSGPAQSYLVLSA